MEKLDARSLRTSLTSLIAITKKKNKNNSINNKSVND